MLSTHLSLLDTELKKINAKILKSNDPDTDGLLDAGEYYIGHGFVAIQRYLITTRCSLRINADKAFKIPPFFRDNLTVAEAVNIGANYWKHVEEWFEKTLEGKSLKGNSANTLGNLEQITPWAEYTCSNILIQIGDKKALELTTVLPKNKEWRNNLLQC